MTTTNIDATEEELRAVAEALKLAAVLDDRAPKADPARIVAWGEQIHRHNLERTDLLDGIQAFYDRPSERCIQIGDLIYHARIIKRDRLDREEDAERDARRATHDHKAADEVSLRLVAGTGIGPTKHRTDRLVKAEIALQCANGRTEAQQAIREFLAAKKEAEDGGKKGRAAS